jgi:hypothetical protein
MESRDSAMSAAAQSQQALIKTPDWEPRASPPSMALTGNRQGMTAGRAAHRYPQSCHEAYMCKPSSFGRGSTVCSSVAINGSVNRDGDAMAWAAENVARWKTYLPEECVRAMMNAGWHWST